MKLTKEDLYNTKWDASEWTTEMKTKWQKKIFELGFSWYSQDVMYLNKDFYYIDMNICYGQDDSFFEDDSNTQKYYADIFPETIVASEARASVKQYNYTKCEFKHAGEAMTAFCEGTELYWCEDGTNYVLCCSPFSVLIQNHKGELYTREETPWYEQISEDNPVYCLSVNRCLTKYTGAITKHGASRCKPLTKEQVKDIVETMEKWK